MKVGYVMVKNKTKKIWYELVSVKISTEFLNKKKGDEIEIRQKKGKKQQKESVGVRL